MKWFISEIKIPLTCTRNKTVHRDNLPEDPALTHQIRHKTLQGRQLCCKN